MDRNKFLENFIKTGFVLRRDMPQIKSTDVTEFLQFLKDSGIRHRKEKVPVRILKATQKELNNSKIEALAKTNSPSLLKPVMVSEDGFILDGHHRVAANFLIDPNRRITIYRINLPIKELLKFVKGFNKVYTKNIEEARVWSKELLDFSRELFNEIKNLLNKSKSRTGDVPKSVSKNFDKYVVLHNGIEVLFDITIDISQDYKLTYSVLGGALSEEIDDDLYQVELEIYLNPVAFPSKFNDLIAELKEVIRHEVEHIMQSAGKRKEKFEEFGERFYEYLTADHEIPAFLAGFLKKAKTKRVSMNQVIRDFLHSMRKSLSKKEANDVYRIWLKKGKQLYPNAVWEE